MPTKKTRVSTSSSPARSKPAAPAKASARPLAAKASAPQPAPAAGSGSTYLLVLSSNEKRGRRFVRLKSPSVLGWFQRAWRLAREGRRTTAELGGEVHGLDALFDAVESRRLAMPATEVELTTLLGKHLKVERDLETEAHFIHVETDDDDVEIEYFLFDDVFLASDEALDRLPSPKRRAVASETDDELEEFEVDDDDDPYTVLIEQLADA